MLQQLFHISCTTPLLLFVLIIMLSGLECGTSLLFILKDCRYPAKDPFCCQTLNAARTKRDEVDHIFIIKLTCSCFYLLSDRLRCIFFIAVYRNFRANGNFGLGKC